MTTLSSAGTKNAMLKVCNFFFNEAATRTSHYIIKVYIYSLFHTADKKLVRLFENLNLKTCLHIPKMAYLIIFVLFIYIIYSFKLLEFLYLDRAFEKSKIESFLTSSQSCGSVSLQYSQQIHSTEVVGSIPTRDFFSKGGVSFAKIDREPAVRQGFI